MKNVLRIATSVVLIGSMLCGMAGCSSFGRGKKARERGDAIMAAYLDLRGDKVSRYFNEDDEDYDAQCKIIKFILVDLENGGTSFDENFKPNKVKLEMDGDEATIYYTYNIKDGDSYEFVLNLEEDGDDWVIADNEDFIVDAVDFIIGIEYAEGKKSTRKSIEEFMDRIGVSKVSKVGQAYYDFLISEYTIACY